MRGDLDFMGMRPRIHSFNEYVFSTITIFGGIKKSTFLRYKRECELYILWRRYQPTALCCLQKAPEADPHEISKTVARWGDSAAEGCSPSI